jgi:hypothetical protein
MQNRRRIDRQPAGWVGSYKLAGESTLGWSDCRVVDTSALGLGIAFDYPEPTDLRGRFISVNLSGDGGALSVRLEGEIKNAVSAISNEVRAGIEFVPLSETERAITAVLGTLNAALVSA